MSKSSEIGLINIYHDNYCNHDIDESTLFYTRRTRCIVIATRTLHERLPVKRNKVSALRRCALCTGWVT